MQNKTGHKNNWICPNPDCNYHSRIFIWDDKSLFPHQRESSSSKTCPIHNLALVCIGASTHIPKAGTKERKELVTTFGRWRILEKFKNDYIICPVLDHHKSKQVTEKELKKYIIIE